MTHLTNTAVNYITSFKGEKIKDNINITQIQRSYEETTLSFNIITQNIFLKGNYNKYSRYIS